ncbi:MAG: anthrone oxygenase family protein [Lapillicoccus sp.]
MTSTTTLLATTCTIGTATIGGVFLAFSSFVMPALGRLSSSAAVSSMQSINITAITPVFMTALFGTAALCVAGGWRAVASWGSPAAPWLLAGCAAYLVGVVGVTAVANVPLNDRLAVLDPASASAATQWADYLVTWTRWNHVRTVAGIASAVAFLVARSR